MTRLGRAGLLAAIVLFCSGHVGSPDAWYEGPAGPYMVLIHVQAPPVIPGIAVVNVRASQPGITQVTAFVNRFDASGSPPPPDVAAPVAENPGWYRTRLWVMTAGSNSVTVGVLGTEGKGSVVIPLAAVAGRRLGFSPFLAGLLIALGLVLGAGLFTLVGAAVRESVLPPGEEPDARRRRRARFAVARVVVVVSLALTGWILWWRAEDARFARNLFRPLPVGVAIDATARPARLQLSILDSVWVHRHDGAWLRARSMGDPRELVEDHGKLVHLFLIAAGEHTGFAHLHPVTGDTVSFQSNLPPLPAGVFLVFADIVKENGFTETLTSSVTVPSGSSSTSVSWATDPDDSFAPGGSVVPPNPAPLGDGTTLTWIRPAAPLIAGEEADLRFAVAAPPGKLAPPEPYLGMAGHAVVMRDDGSVFIHLHPLGTISLAAQAQLLAGDPLKPAHAMSPQQAAGDTLYFPYAFPREGRYTVWVQLKRRGRVLTGAFAATVLPAP